MKNLLIKLKYKIKLKINNINRANCYLLLFCDYKK